MNEGVDPALCPKRPVLGAAVAAVPNSPVEGAENIVAAVVAAGVGKADDPPNEKFGVAVVVAAPNPKAGADCVWFPNPENSDAAVVVTGCCAC